MEKKSDLSEQVVKRLESSAFLQDVLTSAVTSYISTIPPSISRISIKQMYLTAKVGPTLILVLVIRHLSITYIAYCFVKQQSITICRFTISFSLQINTDYYFCSLLWPKH